MKGRIMNIVKIALLLYEQKLLGREIMFHQFIYQVLRQGLQQEIDSQSKLTKFNFSIFNAFQKLNHRFIFLACW